MTENHHTPEPADTPDFTESTDPPAAGDSAAGADQPADTAHSADDAQPAETGQPADAVQSDDAGQSDDAVDAVIERILAAEGSRRSGPLDTQARELQQEHTGFTEDDEQLDLFERRSLRRVEGLSTELEDITEVEYRQLRLERVVLAGLWMAGPVEEAEHSLRELSALAETAGSTVLEGFIQKRSLPDPGTYFGSGKAEQIRHAVAELGADTVIVDSELAPSQRRALEDIVKVKVIDRTGLILDIFAQHAKSREGKAQVELAQMEYMLPRLRGWGGSLSRQAGGQVGAAGGGIGSRGPGETQIELDRRRIHKRMAKLRRDIAAMKPAREAKRANRRRHAVPSVAIAGYTNAGKSSLLNRLTDAGVLVENALFATLDPTVRRASTPDGIGYTLSDTVGFVRQLPTQLVEAFRSTLEEVAESDLILHVVDASHPEPEAQIRAVREVLTEVEAHLVDEIIVLNKADMAEDHVIERIRRREPHTVLVSARTGEGIDELRQLISSSIPRPNVAMELLVPYADGDVVSRLHGEDAEILSSQYLAEGTRLSVRVRPELAAEIEKYRVAVPADESATRGDVAVSDASAQRDEERR
ncbi:GTPase HflX [Nesterenkonia aerolata]|uniref:GTPase HflX n=1 Tax=Nesterenkonia aerolata TaxID=3074079 RepID=A0ABU2DN90_9MICC|nr:GTPase HflX [Nesterenkonia sp. LY-0111]MDR8017967.1 GTPase HflX [Nesterenkonia sp. LY-0111]